MVALAADHRDMHLRRWMISAGIVVLAHAGIASAVLTWRNLSMLSETQTPIEIRLTPESITPPPVTTAPQAAPTRPATKAPEGPTTAKREEAIESRPGAELPRATGPVIVTPEDRAQREHDALYANPGTSGGCQANPLSGPIDTTLANPNLRPGTAGKANDWRKALLSRQAPKPGPPPWLRLPRVANSTIERNAIGALELNRALGTGGPIAEVNALGMPQQSTSGVAGAIRPYVPHAPASPFGHNVTNALGQPVQVPGTGASGLRQGSGPLASSSPPLGLNGTTFARPGSSVGTLGGAAKNTGGLSGSSFRPK
jgi:hypothetical protein